MNWIVSGSGDSLVASNSQIITANQVNQTSPFDLSTLTGSDLSNTTKTVSAFAASNCTGSVRCTVKLSIVRALETVAGNGMPYLEYRISTPALSPIPQQWTRVSAEGYSQ
ncbi:MAG: hypothetical protein QMC36_01995 [Patescibacteria group bacterium]